MLISLCSKTRGFLTVPVKLKRNQFILSTADWISQNYPQKMTSKYFLRQTGKSQNDVTGHQHDLNLKIEQEIFYKSIDTEKLMVMKTEADKEIYQQQLSCGPTRRKRKHISVKFEEKARLPLAVTQCIEEEHVISESTIIIKQEQEEDWSRLKPVVANRKEIKTESITHWEPERWLEQMTNIMEMRKHRDAPVDTMGCDVISDATASPQEYRFQVLVSLMLSSQTRDEITSAAMARLRQHGCNVNNILSIPDELLGRLIYPAGFWKKKTIYIKKTSQILKNEFEGDIPNTVEGLCCLPGVGPKMAHLTMKCAWGVVSGIGVDTHVHRISNRLGWTPRPTKNPEETRKVLEGWLPREHWSTVNQLLVGFGQQSCLPVGPKCSMCLNILCCPVGLGHKPASSKKRGR